MKNLIFTTVVVLATGSLLSSCYKQKCNPVPGTRNTLNDGLIAYYPFNGNAIDETVHSNDGTVHGAQLAADRFGNVNSAYYFDGDLDYIDIGNSDSIKRYKSDYTVSGWIKLSSYSTSYNSIILSNRSKKTPSTSGTFIGIGGEPSSLFKKLEFIKNAAVTSDTYTFDYLPSASDVLLDSWTFFTVTYSYKGNDLNTVSIYLNGQLNASKTMGETINPLDINTYLGCEPSLDPVEYSYHGYMDEIRIYNRVLSDDEIKKLYALK